MNYFKKIFAGLLILLLFAPCSFAQDEDLAPLDIQESFVKAEVPEVGGVSEGVHVGIETSVIPLTVRLLEGSDSGRRAKVDFYTSSDFLKNEMPVEVGEILVLASTDFGVSFPALLLILNSYRPLWVIVNNESLAAEIVRTLVGNMALKTAAPVTTFIVSYYYSGRSFGNK